MRMSPYISCRLICLCWTGLLDFTMKKFLSPCLVCADVGARLLDHEPVSQAEVPLMTVSADDGNFGNKSAHEFPHCCYTS